MAKTLRLLTPKKSLQALLAMWFLLFSVVPAAFVTGYSLVQFEDAFNKEIHQRLESNFRELDKTFKDIEGYLLNYGNLHATDADFVYNISTTNNAKIRHIVEQWMRNYSASQISTFDRDGKLIVAVGKNVDGGVESIPSLERGDVYLAKTLLDKFENQNQFIFRDLHPKRGLELIVYSKAVMANGRLAGYLEEIFSINQSYIETLKKRLGLDIVVYNAEIEPIISTHEDLLFTQKNLLKDSFANGKNNFFEIPTRGNSYGLYVKPLTDDKTVYLGLAAPRNEIKKVTSGINRAVFSVMGLVIILIIIVLFSVSNVIVRPLKNLVRAAKKIEDGEVAQVPIETETEVGLLTLSFNNMSRKIAQAQKELKNKIEELESANKEIQETQGQLIQSAKMVSLGQLVAGVAHELNNPIGFIYSNMNHLKEYSDKLVKLVEVAERDPKNLHEAKKEADYDYIVDDLPKLIKSCEDGARRVRDIVVDLRNFSRADEADKQDYSLEEGLDNTLNLLAGEYKNRIQIHKNYAGVPKMKCYANQINQALMNILANAIHAIDGRGDIWVTTKRTNSEVMVSIRDSGRGIPEKIRDKIFDPFFTTKNVGKGTGLGLSITYGIIQRHNGDIEVKSTEGQGTEFIIHFPI